VITKFVYAAVAAVLLAPVPALAGDLGPPGYYGDDSYDDYAPDDYAPDDYAPVVRRRS
jgi:hypothetical protein